jgi:hypothetical protein
MPNCNASGLCEIITSSECPQAHEVLARCCGPIRTKITPAARLGTTSSSSLRSGRVCDLFLILTRRRSSPPACVLGGSGGRHARPLDATPHPLPCWSKDKEKGKQQQGRNRNKRTN